MYGLGEAEKVFARLWDKHNSIREQVVVQSKVGIREWDDPNPGSPRRFDLSANHIVTATEPSLKQLKTDYLDILLLHQPKNSS